MEITEVTESMTFKDLRTPASAGWELQCPLPTVEAGGALQLSASTLGHHRQQGTPIALCLRGQQGTTASHHQQEGSSLLPSTAGIREDPEAGGNPCCSWWPQKAGGDPMAGGIPAAPDHSRQQGDLQLPTGTGGRGESLELLAPMGGRGDSHSLKLPVEGDPGAPSLPPQSPGYPFCRGYF